jgi:hypothetical protein
LTATKVPVAASRGKVPLSAPIGTLTTTLNRPPGPWNVPTRIPGWQLSGVTEPS